MTGSTIPAGEAMREAVEARALATELTTYADQLIRMETQAGFAGPDTSVRVKEPQWLAQLMRRAASALQVRRLDVALADNARLTAERDEARAKLAKATETYTDDSGYVWSPPTAWAYFAACRALSTARVKDDAAEAALTTLRADHAAEVARLKTQRDGLQAIVLADDAKALAEYEWDRANKLADDNLRLTTEAAELREALRGVVRIADRKTIEFDRARAALATTETTDA